MVLTNAAGQVSAEEDYFYLSGLTYSSSATLGTINTNYYKTSYGYDFDGNLDRTETPNGTIYRIPVSAERQVRRNL